MQELAKVNWSDMFQSEDSTVRKMARELFVYCLYRNGFGFSPKTFIHLASVKTKLNLGYTDLINQNVAFFDNSFVEENFLEQFRRNHITELRIVPDIKLATNSKGTVRNTNNNVLTFESKTADFLDELLSYDKKSPVAMIKYGNNYYKLTSWDSEKIGTPEAVVMYVKVDPLGNKNNFLEYDMNERFINTVISKDAVDNDNADNEPDNNDSDSKKPGTSGSEVSNPTNDGPITPAAAKSLNDMQKELKGLGMEIVGEDKPTADLLGLNQETQDQVNQIKEDNNTCEF